MTILTLSARERKQGSILMAGRKWTLEGQTLHEKPEKTIAFHDGSFYGFFRGNAHAVSVKKKHLMTYKGQLVKMTVY